MYLRKYDRYNSNDLAVGDAGWQLAEELVREKHLDS